MKQTQKDILYKYRRWTDVYEKRTITNQEVWFSRPSSFEDPIDCKNPIRYDYLSEPDIIRLYDLRIREDFPSLTCDEYLQKLAYWVKEPPFREPKLLKGIQDGDFIKFDKLAGVLCVTENPNIIKMWEKYCDDHQGFVIGFKASILLNIPSIRGYVEYDKILPIIYPRPIHSYGMQSYLQIFHKLTKWSYEKEFRMLKFKLKPLSDSDRAIVLPKEAITEIILGKDMPQEHRIEIQDFASKNLPQTKIIQR
ncbi:DUF2971 domain-containing protein [Parabacteroides sp. Marseille-P3160]|uniref:DUF2971 domain-containing protein n=1 Tax=Parabacteroides sp. Marseille-P3160 TaxID=1917887 RepID=UPI0009BC22FA|nr:DUF2971 domain-containing protein [Parabacteroides sp. Marseille-P3160]